MGDEVEGPYDMGVFFWATQAPIDRVIPRGIRPVRNGGVGAETA